MFIYCIRNVINNKRYIGQSTQKDQQRLWEHKCYLKNGTHQNRYLQRSWNKYGCDAFEFFIICECTTLEELNSAEEEWVEKYKTLNRRYGYNIRYPGNNRRHSEYTKKLISKSKRGISVHTKESKEAIAKAMRNKKHTEESKRKRSEKLKNYQWPIAIRDQWAQSHRKVPYPMLVDPSGNEHNVINATRFAKEHNLLQQSVSKLFNNQLQVHRGWTVKRDI